MPLQNLFGDLALEATQEDSKDSVERVAHYLAKIANLLERSDVIRQRMSSDTSGNLNIVSQGGSVTATTSLGGSTSFTASVAATPTTMLNSALPTSPRLQIITS